jgi:biopolymer transport protein ExbB
MSFSVRAALAALALCLAVSAASAQAPTGQPAAPAIQAPATQAPLTQAAPPAVQQAPAAQQAPAVQQAPAAQQAPALQQAPATEEPRQIQNLRVPRDLSPWSMFMSADVLVKGVMLGLAFASLVTWTIFLGKTLQLFIARQRVKRALARISKVATLAEAQLALGQARNVVATLLAAAIA